MATGVVKWFNPTKGYQFIQPQGGGKDAFSSALAAVFWPSLPPKYGRKRMPTAIANPSGSQTTGRKVCSVSF